MTDLNRKCNSQVNKDFGPTAKFLVGRLFIHNHDNISSLKVAFRAGIFSYPYENWSELQGLQGRATISDDWVIDFSGPTFNADRAFSIVTYQNIETGSLLANILYQTTL